jgi:hypothetical protein
MIFCIVFSSVVGFADSWFLYRKNKQERDRLLNLNSLWYAVINYCSRQFFVIIYFHTIEFSEEIVDIDNYFQNVVW